MRMTSTLISVLATLALFGYLLDLMVRTAMFARAAAVGGDILILVSVLCAVGVLSATVSLLLRTEPRWLSRTVLGLSALLSVIYALLYAVGKFGPVSL